MKTILSAIADRKLFARWFKDPESWAAWHAFLAALFGLPMSEADVAIFRECTGRTEPPLLAAVEAWLICGRRAGKSFMLALVAVYLATFHSYRKFLAPGERATIMIIAHDRRQCRVIWRRLPGIAHEHQLEIGEPSTVRVPAMSDLSNRSHQMACPRHKAMMKEVVRIAPLVHESGLIAYECPACRYVTSILWRPNEWGRPE